jgi:hypothetical protein
MHISHWLFGILLLLLFELVLVLEVMVNNNNKCYKFWELAVDTWEHCSYLLTLAFFSSSSALYSPLLDIGLSNFSPSRSIFGYWHPAPASRAGFSHRLVYFSFEINKDIDGETY